MRHTSLAMKLPSQKHIKKELQILLIKPIKRDNEKPIQYTKTIGEIDHISTYHNGTCHCMENKNKITANAFGDITINQIKRVPISSQIRQTKLLIPKCD